MMIFKKIPIAVLGNGDKGFRRKLGEELSSSLTLKNNTNGKRKYVGFIFEDFFSYIEKNEPSFNKENYFFFEYCLMISSHITVNIIESSASILELNMIEEIKSASNNKYSNYFLINTIGILDDDIEPEFIHDAFKLRTGYFLDSTFKWMRNHNNKNVFIPRGKGNFDYFNTSFKNTYNSDFYTLKNIQPILIKNIAKKFSEVEWGTYNLDWNFALLEKIILTISSVQKMRFPNHAIIPNLLNKFKVYWLTYSKYKRWW